MRIEGHGRSEAVLARGDGSAEGAREECPRLGRPPLETGKSANEMAVGHRYKREKRLGRLTTTVATR